LAQIVAAARAAGLVVLDGVFNDIDDDDGLRRQCTQGVEFGFDGKTLIHPRQLEFANQAFTPSPDEVRWSRKVVEAFDLSENNAKGVLRVEGRMVERLHLEEARRVLAISDAVANRRREDRPVASVKG
jgi:citrate lyase subunit beta/citryl-CoA lyase